MRHAQAVYPGLLLKMFHPDPTLLVLLPPLPPLLWACPCAPQGWICNSSICMKRRGLKPTGIAIYDAQERGFKSVAHLLQEQLRKRNNNTGAGEEGAGEEGAAAQAAVPEGGDAQGAGAVAVQEAGPCGQQEPEEPVVVLGPSGRPMRASRLKAPAAAAEPQQEAQEVAGADGGVAGEPLGLPPKPRGRGRPRKAEVAEAPLAVNKAHGGAVKKTTGRDGTAMEFLMI